MVYEIKKQIAVSGGCCTKRTVSRLLFIIVLAMLMIFPVVVNAGDDENGKKLIIYYSRTGKSKTICETLQKSLNADLIGIRDKKDRSGTWGFVVSAYDSFFDRETEIEPIHPDLSSYSLVIVVSPVWNWKICAPIRTLINRNSFKGKIFMMYTTANIDIKKYDSFTDDAPFIKRFLRDYLRDKRTLMQELVAKSGADVIGHVHIATKETTKAQLVQLAQNSVKHLQGKLLLYKSHQIAGM